MSTKKKLEALDIETQYSFDNVKRDVLFLFNLIEAKGQELNSIKKTVKQLVREVTRSHRHGTLSGNTYPTLAGKVKAIADQLGIEFAVQKRVVTPTKIVAQKKAAEKKASKK